jgi:hypothetical protein
MQNEISKRHRYYKINWQNGETGTGLPFRISVSRFSFGTFWRAATQPEPEENLLAAIRTNYAPAAAEPFPPRRIKSRSRERKHTHVLPSPHENRL